VRGYPSRYTGSNMYPWILGDLEGWDSEDVTAAAAAAGLFGFGLPVCVLLCYATLFSAVLTTGGSTAHQDQTLTRQGQGLGLVGSTTAWKW
jgi:hypothetical protein